MTKDRFERRAYRRSPGRQYGYDYDPLRSNRGGTDQNSRSNSSEADERLNTHITSTNRSAVQFAPRPDPRRTRQLLRQSILAGKFHSSPLPEDDLQQPEDEMQAPSSPTLTETDTDQNMYEEQDDSTLYSNRYRARHNRTEQPQAPTSAPFIETAEEEEAEQWNELNFVDPDIGYEDPFDQRLGHSQALPSPRNAAPVRNHQRTARRYDPVEYDEDEYVDEQDLPPIRRQPKKRNVTRRNLLVGLGIAAGGVAAYELAPRIPQALHDVGTNIEHQVQDAYNKGLAAGANEVRKDFVTTLENLEGYSLDAAMATAVLTRRAYDAFVSPLVTLAATVTGDFLDITLRALENARGFLAKFNQDNDTLAALQTVLETWINQVHEVPKEIQSITASDLDGAQSYLRGLQRKLDEEKAKLNGQVTPTPASTKKTK